MSSDSSCKAPVRQPAVQAYVDSLPDPKTLETWDDAYLWHPFTPHAVYRDEEPLLVVAADGHYLIDIHGDRYLDGVASIWCNTFGHRRAEIDSAIRSQLDRVAHATLLGNSSAPAILLAKRLVDLAPAGIDKVFFSDNGSTAVEVALKMAYQYWQQADGGKQAGRTRFLALENAYNGDTVGAVSVGGIDLFHQRFRPLLFDTLRAPSPYRYRCDACKGRSDCSGDCLRAFEQTLRRHAQEIAAVIVEPGFQGAGGILPYPEGYLQRVRELTEAVGTLLIFDEVAVGMGRSGAMFACEREGIVPDFVCIAKGLTGGYLPVAATLTGRKIFDAFVAPPEEGKTFFHGHTYTGNTLGCAAALATLDVFEQERILERLAQTIPRFHQAVGRLARCENVGDVRHYGLAAGVELVADRESRKSFAPAERRGYRVCRAARDKGVFLRPLGDVIVLMPPLTVTLEEIEQLVDSVAHGIDTVMAEGSQ